MSGLQYERAASLPGETILRLTAPWAGLATGTEVRPVSAGHDNETGRHERTVRVVSGPRTGETVTGEF